MMKIKVARKTWKERVDRTASASVLTQVRRQLTAAKSRAKYGFPISATNGSRQISKRVLRRPTVIEVTINAELAYNNPTPIASHFPVSIFRRNKYIESSANNGAKISSSVVNNSGLPPVTSERSAKRGVKGWAVRPEPTPSACHDWP